MPGIHNRSFFAAVFALLVVLLARGTTHAVTSTISQSVTITARVGSTSIPNSGGSGGGGVSPLSGAPTTINFSGMAYPSSKIVILQDGAIVITTTADQNANFSATLNNLSQGSYTFSLYTEDKNGLHSVSFSFPVYITAGAIVNIGDIILAPTIDVEKAEVKRGDNEAIFGFAVPNSKVTISVHSDGEHIVSTTATSTGVYLYNFDTSVLDYGDHTAQSRAALLDRISAQTDPVSFIVAEENKTKTAGCQGQTGDLNCDGKVNLVDFSIMAYWYKKGSTPPVAVDLNHDGKITLVDFSILAYHWTG